MVESVFIFQQCRPSYQYLANILWNEVCIHSWYHLLQSYFNCRKTDPLSDGNFTTFPGTFFWHFLQLLSLETFQNNTRKVTDSCTRSPAFIRQLLHNPSPRMVSVEVNCVWFGRMILRFLLPPVGLAPGFRTWHYSINPSEIFYKLSKSSVSDLKALFTEYGRNRI